MAVTTTRPVSPAQTTLITRLVGEKDIPQALADSILETLPTMTTRTASATIDALFAAPKKQAAGTVKATEGYYAVNGQPFVVVKAKTTGRLYAKRLTSHQGESGKTVWSWDYAPGQVFNFTEEQRLTLEQAKTFGHLHGVCIKCATPLTDPKSVEAGIGPVCAKSFR